MKKFEEEIVANSELESKELISSVKEDLLLLKVDIINYKTEILIGMFIFWIAQDYSNLCFYSFVY